MNKKIIIVGGVAGGATAAARARRLDENAEIILIEKNPYISFANCGLPYYLGGVIEGRENLFVASKESIKSKYNVIIKDMCEVIAIDKDKKEIEIKDLRENKTYKETYDSLLLSTGASPIVPNISGIDSENLFTLTNIEDTDAIYNYIEKNSPKRVAVIGGGFIGMEMVENLSRRGMEISVIEKIDHILPHLDNDISIILENHLREEDIKLYLSDGLEKIIDNGQKIVLNSGKIIETDMIILSIGVKPNSEIAINASLEANPRRGLIVDDAMKTSDSDIFAVGDMIEVKDFNTGGKTMVPLAGPANKQARLVASNILGKKERVYRGTQGTSIVKIFYLTAALTGLSEKQLNAMGKKYGEDYQITIVHPFSHATFYPRALPMTIKLIFETETNRVLGAQIVGYDGVDKRIDVIATLIHFKGTIYDLSELELAYAPPYSSAKDPVNVAGFAASNLAEGLSEAVLIREMDEISANTTFIDVREADELRMGIIPNSINIPLSKLRKEIETLSKDKEYVVNCAIGLRGYIAERIMKQNGFKVRNLVGGYKSYMESIAKDK